MRHRVAVKHFNRDTKHRQALLRNLVRSLVEQGEIVTTITKAKETKRLADKLIYRAKTDTVANRRVLHSFFGKRDVVNTLVERVAPIFKDRSSGFTRIGQIGIRRGDNVTMVKLSLVEKVERSGTLKSGRDYSKVAKKKAPAKATKKVETKATKVSAKKAVKAVSKPAAKKTVKKSPAKKK